MRGIFAASRGTVVLRNWTRPRLSRKRITMPDGVGKTSLNARSPLPAALVGRGYRRLFCREGQQWSAADIHLLR